MGNGVNKNEEEKSKRKNKGKGDSTSIPEKLILGGISLVITFIIVSIVAGAFALFKIGSKSMPVASSVSSNEAVNILLLGMDIGDPNQPDNEEIKRTDTIMVLNYNPKNKEMKVVSIPRDTLINVNGKNAKINSAYASGGYPKIENEVENLLNININYIVKIDYNAFKSLIDAIGGVKMQIQRNMIYDDEGQNLHINFKAGETVKLDGEKAEEFFRWRKNNDGSGLANGDLDRIENQQKFISKVIDKCTSPLILFRVPKILMALGDNVETNIPASKILSYGLKFIGVKSSNVSMATAAGVPKTINGESFLIFDKSANKNLTASLSSSGDSLVDASKDNIRIKILNATKINGLAAELTQKLNGLGYTKIDTGNIEETGKSIILTNNDAMLKTIQKDVSISKTDEKESKTEYNDYDVIIILGKDFKTFGD